MVARERRLVVIWVPLERKRRNGNGEELRLFIGGVGNLFIYFCEGDRFIFIFILWLRLNFGKL